MTNAVNVYGVTVDREEHPVDVTTPANEVFADFVSEFRGIFGQGVPLGTILKDCDSFQ